MPPSSSASIPFDDQVIGAISEVLRIPAPSITPDSELVKDLDVDSLYVVQLAMAFEETFNIHVPESDLPKLVSVRDLMVLSHSKWVEHPALAS